MSRPFTIPTPGQDETYAARCAVVVDRHNPDMVHVGRTATHDALIVGEGGWRRTGVWWTHHIARQGQKRYREIIEDYGGYSDTWTDESIAYRETMIEKLDDPRALLIVAWCITTALPYRAVVE